MYDRQGLVTSHYIYLLILNAFAMIKWQKPNLEKCYFTFPVTSNRILENSWKLPQRISVTQQTDTLNVLLISRTYFSTTPLSNQNSCSRLFCKRLFWENSQKIGKNTCVGLSILIQLQELGLRHVKKGLQPIIFR